MVDRKETFEGMVENEAGPDRAALKVWVKPRLETFSVTGETATGTGFKSADGGGAGHCIS